MALERGTDSPPARTEDAGHAPGDALTTDASGKVKPVNTDVITPLNVRDPSALVMSPGSMQLPPCAEKACDCSQDDLHRYKPKSPKAWELEALRKKGAKRGRSEPQAAQPPAGDPFTP